MATDHEAVELIDVRVVVFLALSVLVAALTAALAQVAVPYPLSAAPFTLQTVGVYVAGLLLGPLWAAFSLLVYLLAGVLGLPVFASGTAGFGVLAGPTGGYLVSFPVAGALIGGIVHRGTTVRPLDRVPTARQVVGLAAGLLVVYAVGAVWMSLSLSMPLPNAIVQGAVVFLPGDAVKAVAVLGLVTGGHLATASRRPR